MARHDPHGKEDLGERFSQFASVCGITDGHDLRSANDTPALNALKALRGAPISMGRGEIPVGGCQPPSGLFLKPCWNFTNDISEPRPHEDAVFVENCVPP